MEYVGLTFTFILLALLSTVSLIDLRTMKIPNILNAMILLTGCFYIIIRNTNDFPYQIFNVALVCTLLFSVRHLHFLLTASEGLGIGDIKLAGAGAVWLPMEHLPLMLLVSSMSALIVVLGLSGRQRRGGIWRQRVAFGPFLAIGILTSYLI